MFLLKINKITQLIYHESLNANVLYMSWNFRNIFLDVLPKNLMNFERFNLDIGTNGRWDFGISDLVKNPDGTDI